MEYEGWRIMRVDTTSPSNAYQHDADDDLKLGEADGYYDLVRAMIAREVVKC